MSFVCLFFYQHPGLISLDFSHLSLEVSSPSTVNYGGIKQLQRRWLSRGTWILLPCLSYTNMEDQYPLVIAEAEVHHLIMTLTAAHSTTLVQ